LINTMSVELNVGVWITTIALKLIWPKLDLVMVDIIL
jgi:hypothetical protein